MLVLLHFSCTLVFVGLWYVSGLYCDKLSALFWRQLLRALRGALLAMSICAFVAAAVCHSPLIPPDMFANDSESRNYVFIALLVGLGMIGSPIGFLAGLARGQHIEE